MACMSRRLGEVLDLEEPVPLDPNVSGAVSKMLESLIFIFLTSNNCINPFRQMMCITPLLARPANTDPAKRGWSRDLTPATRGGGLARFSAAKDVKAYQCDMTVHAEQCVRVC